MGRTIENLEHNVSGFCRAPGTGEGMSPPSGAKFMFSSNMRLGPVIKSYACGATYLGFREAKREEVLKFCEGCPSALPELPEAVGSVVEAVG